MTENILYLRQHELPNHCLYPLHHLDRVSNQHSKQSNYSKTKTNELTTSIYRTGTVTKTITVPTSTVETSTVTGESTITTYVPTSKPHHITSFLLVINIPTNKTFFLSNHLHRSQLLHHNRGDNVNILDPHHIGGDDILPHDQIHHYRHHGDY